VVLRPHRAEALFLGDGVSLDQVDGAWRDRFCDPLIAELHRQGATTLLMQRGNLDRLPWCRPTFAANTIIHWGQLLAGPLHVSGPLAISLPEHEAVVEFIAQSGVPALGLNPDALRARAEAVSITASGFERVLDIVRPSLCFVVGYFWGMGHALMLACRRRRVLSIELQRDGRGGEQGAYRWTAVPENGCEILPAVFWTSTKADADAIETWTCRLQRPWHRAVHGGHPQLATWLNDEHDETRATDAKINDVRASAFADREILVALQNVPGHEELWNKLATIIEASPLTWRWWLRRHPSTLGLGDHGLGSLLALRQPNVVIDLATALPLPALLRHMNALVTATSGSAVEAAIFGVKTFFLSPEAENRYPRLIEAEHAEIVSDMTTLEHRLCGLSRTSNRSIVQPELAATLSRLTRMADEYRRL
jgi:hypothetical protein